MDALRFRTTARELCKMNQILFRAFIAIAAISMTAGSSFAQGPGGRFNRAAWLHPATHGDYAARNHAMSKPWHGGYYYLQTGQPTALVVPPNATMQQNYSWGVSQNTLSPIYHQFQPSAPISGGGGLFRATPVWPSHTNQFGVYPVRAPW